MTCVDGGTSKGKTCQYRGLKYLSDRRLMLGFCVFHKTKPSKSLPRKSFIQKLNQKSSMIGVGWENYVSFVEFT